MNSTSYTGKRWVGFDWDATLCRYSTWLDQGTRMGPPIDVMWDRVRHYLREDEYEVRIFTARACDANGTRDEDLAEIRRICVEQCGRELSITNQKDFACARIYDDVAVAVMPNAGACFSWDGLDVL